MKCMQLLKQVKRRRQKLFDVLPKNTGVLLNSSEMVYLSNDIPHVYRQDTEFLYMTGIHDPKCMMVLMKDRVGDMKYVLFVENQSERSKVWDGKKLDMERAKMEYEADEAYDYDDVESVLPKLMEPMDFLYLDLPSKKSIPTAVLDATVDRHDALRPIGRVLQKHRSIKSDYEIEMMKVASDLAGKGYLAMMKECKSGMKEYALEALFEYTVKKHGAKRMSFPPVVAGGGNGSIIHYIENVDTLKDGELVLVDAGCEYNGYASDVTRTWPIQGTFTKQQRMVYDLVLKCQLECIKMASYAFEKPISLDDIHHHAVSILSKGLLEELKVVKGPTLQHVISEKQYFPYFPTHVGHYLGMDVHDTPLMSQTAPLQPGMVITIEPGLYFNQTSPHFTNIGIRIEDNILITKNGIENLTESIPKLPEDLESVIGQIE